MNDGRFFNVGRGIHGKLDGLDLIIEITPDGAKLCLTQDMVRRAGREGLLKIAEWFLNDLDIFLSDLHAQD